MMFETPPPRIRRILLFVALLFALPLTVAAQTYTVNSVADDADANAGDGVCATSGGVCTLRAAIQEANAIGGHQTIEFNLSSGNDTHVILPGSRLPDITQRITIDGSTEPGNENVCQTTVADRPAYQVLLVGTNMVGGLTPGLYLTRNANNSVIRGLGIADFIDTGLLVQSNNNRIECNAIGAQGGFAGNGIGVWVQPEPHQADNTGNVIGTNGNGSGDAFEGNLINGNDGRGVYVNTSSTVVAGNYIGRGNTSPQSQGNGGPGIQVTRSSNRIGSNNDGTSDDLEVNVIHDNGGDGVFVSGGMDNRINRNSIFENTGLGIDLNPDGVNGNDAGDGDGGPNNGQNSPDVMGVNVFDGNLLVSFSIDTPTTAASYPLRVEFFKADADGQEGETYINFISINSGQAGSTIVASLTSGVAFQAGDQIVATATDADGNTSEFSAAVTVVEAAVVNSTADDDDANPGDLSCETAAGDCTLRAAITELNATGFDKVHFDIPASDPNCTGGICTIAPTTALSSISKPVEIDGSTQPGNAGVCITPIASRPTYGIVLDGTSAGSGVTGLRLASNSGGSVIRGLVIQNFSESGIAIGSDGNKVMCSFIGVGADGSTPAGNGRGVSFGNASSNTSGTDGDGENDANEGNLISGNTQDGIFFNDAGASNNTVAGNYIGTDKAGTGDLGNAVYGIHLDRASATRIGTNGDGVSDTVERNVISGNGSHGIYTVRNASSHIIAGNYIGVDATGTATLGNTGNGIWLRDSNNNRVGTNSDGSADAAERNVISGNGGAGIQGGSTGSGGQTTSGNVIAGNYIGADATGAAGLGNVGAGVTFGAESNSRIGSNDDGVRDDLEGNLIVSNGGDGIALTGGTSATGNRFSRNQTYSNAGLGIDIDPNGANANDTNDSDTGPNNRQNFPTMASAVVLGNGDVAVTYAVDATTGNAAYPLRVEVFESADGEGQTWLGTLTYASGDAQNTVTQSFTPALAVSNGDLIVATATDANGNTSEFTSPLLLRGLLVVNDTGDADDANPGDGTCATAGSVCTLRAALSEANGTNETTEINFAIPSSDPGCSGNVCTITPTLALPAITRPVVLDGATQTGADCSTRTLTIEVDGQSAPSSSHGLTLNAGASGSLVRGLAIFDFSNGIRINGSADNQVACSFVGTNAAGANGLGNTIGILVTGAGATGNIIGTDGADGEAGNVIVRNSNRGVDLEVAGSGNVIGGNLIGVAPDGTTALGNTLFGVRIAGTSDTQVGGLLAAQANTIAHTNGFGVAVQGNDSHRNNAILGNRIFSNTELGIDVGGSLRTPNDTDDDDTGSNRAQNFPVMDLAVLPSSGDLTVTFTVDTGTSFATYPLRVEFFLADADGEEGQTFLGATSYTSGDAQTQVMTTFTPAATVSYNDKIVATATDAAGNTSEFSEAATVIPPPVIVNSTGDDEDANTGDGVCATAGGACTLRAAIQQTNALAEANSIEFDINPSTDAGCNSTTGVCTIAPGSGFPQFIRPVVLDGTTQPGSDCTTKTLKIELDGRGAGTGIRGLTLAGGASGSLVRGLAIYGFSGQGIQIGGTSIQIACTIIGTDTAGSSGLGNATQGTGGIEIFGADATGNVIGTNSNDAAEGNVISGNERNGIIVQLGTGNTIAGNWIGVAPDGTTPLGNALRGVVMTNGASGHQIGGTGSKEGNVIAYNGDAGVFISSAAGTSQHTILGNEIFSNGGPGIDLNAVDANDADDADEGANRGQNFPDIDTATLAAGGDVTVTYMVDTAPANATYPLRVDFYRADASGQGQHWLGSDTYTEDDYNGTAVTSKTQAGAFKTTTFTPASITPTLTESDEIVATATDADGNTSEFSGTPKLLPVELVSFEAVGRGADVQLRWKTASETNNAGFEVQVWETGGGKGDEGGESAWSVLGFVEGEGTTAEPQHYTFVVAGLEVGTHVFRLRQVDFDGRFEYSPEVEVVIEMAESYLLSAAYPNPFNPQTSFSLAVRQAQEVRVEVFDVLGRKVEVLYQGGMQANASRVFAWEAGDHPSGLYFIRVTGERFAETRQVMLLK